jgi:hypothetical protein
MHDACLIKVKQQNNKNIIQTVNIKGTEVYRVAEKTFGKYVYPNACQSVSRTPLQPVTVPGFNSPQNKPPTKHNLLMFVP